MPALAAAGERLGDHRVRGLDPIHVRLLVLGLERPGTRDGRELEADLFIMATDVEAVFVDWGKPDARPIRRASPTNWLP